MEEHKEIVLHVSSEVREVLDKRRILVTDIKEVIYHAEGSGEIFVHAETGHRKAFFRPHKVTFWVEYSPADQGYDVHTAYAHRMNVVGGMLP
jgi:glutamate synthase (NADPH/NADH) small chain